MKIAWELLKTTIAEWQEDGASRLAAALSFYTIFSLAPMLIIVLAIVSAAVGESAARAEVRSHIVNLLGGDGARFILQAGERARQEFSGILASILGAGTLLFGATVVFAELKHALNTVWDVRPKPGLGWGWLVRTRLLSFAVVLVVGVLLVISVAVATTVSALGNYFEQSIPGLTIFLQITHFTLSFVMATLLFAMLFKILPDVQIQWSDVWTGAAMTSLLFTIGKSLIGIYLGGSTLKSIYGAAGSFVIVLLWIYYSSQVFLFGAELTQVWASRYGSQIRPSKHALAESEVRSSR